jgi:hypothetical protein
MSKMRKHLEVFGFFRVHEITFMEQQVLSIRLISDTGSTISICPIVLEPRKLGHVLTLMHAYTHDTELDISYSSCDYTEDEQLDLLYTLCVEFLSRKEMFYVKKNLMFTLNLSADKYEELTTIGADFYVDVEPAPPSSSLR